MRQTQRKRYQREKNKIIPKKKRKAKTEQKAITNQPISSSCLLYLLLIPSSL